MQVFVSAIGIKAPGFSDAEDLKRLSTDSPVDPTDFSINAPELLPRAEKRRSSDSVRIALEAAQQVLDQKLSNSLQVSALFSSAYGDPMVTHKLCDMLSQQPSSASPTLFHNSVHNAPAGYWSISSHYHGNTNSIAAGDHSFANGLWLAASHCLFDQGNVLLTCYDLPYPEPLNQKCPVSMAFAVSLLLSAQQQSDSRYQLQMQLASDQPPTRMSIAQWEALRLGNPAARSLPLLQAIQEAKDRSVLLQLNPHQQLKIDVAQIR